MTNGLRRSLITRRAVLLGVAALATPAIARPRIPRLLYIGNSFTLEHNVPLLINDLASQNGIEVHYGVVGINGRTLSGHVERSNLFQLAEDIEPDTVILQEHSAEALTPQGRIWSATAMANLRDLAGNAVLYPAWPRHHAHEMYTEPEMPRTPEAMAEIVIRHHQEQGQKLNAVVAPMTEAWMTALEAGMHLYADDLYHASPAGAWLAANVLTRSLGIPVTRFETYPRGVHSSTARYLAGIAATAGS